MTDISIGSINIIGGRALNENPYVLIRTQIADAHSGRHTDALVACLDLPPKFAQQNSRACQALLQLIADSYVSAPGGSSTALRVAMRVANDRLIELSNGIGERVQGALTCLAISGNNVTMGQCGAALAYARAQNGAFERIAPNGALVPFGAPDTHVYLANFAWQPGDVFLLSGQSAIQPLDNRSEDLLNNSMSRGNGAQIARTLALSGWQGQLSGAVVSIEAAPMSVPAAQPVADIGARAAEQVATPIHQTISENVAQPRQRAQQTRSSDVLGGLLAARLKVRNAVRDVLGRVGRTAADTAQRGISSAAQATQQGIETVGRQMLPADIVPPRATPTQAERNQRLTLMVIAFVLPVIVAAATAVAYTRLNVDADKRQLINAVQAQIDIAKNAPSDVSSLPILRNALNSITTYESKTPNDTTFAADRNALRARIDQIGKVQRVKPVVLKDNFALSSTPRRIAASDSGVYVLEPAANTVEQYVLNQDRTGFIAAPVTLTLPGGTSVPNPIKDIAWATPKNNRWGATDGAILFNATTAYLYSSSSGQLSQIRLPTSPVATSPLAGDLYNNQFYMLDVGAGQVWRYTPQGDNRDVARISGYFSSPNANLQDAVDMAIDGGLFILKRDGSILRYLTGAQKPFGVTGLSEPFIKPVAIASSAADPEEGYVLVADAGLGSLIQISKTGEVLRQIKGEADDFAGIEDMSLDFSSNTAYLVTNKKLLMFKLP